MQENNNMSVEVLQDEQNGKVRPWRPKKIRSLKVADSFQRLGFEKKAMRVRFCGSALGFLKNLKTGEKKLYSADFCRERLCPMCQWRKSMKVFHQVSKVMDRAEQENKDIVPLFLTLTLKNCSGDDLKTTLDIVFKGWNLLWKQRKMERIAKGWFRALEVTYNKESDTFHPHIHAVLVVDKGYFKGKDYMETVDWVQTWKKVLKLDYDPICDIRKIKNGKGKHKAVAEVAKYTLKDTDFVHDDNELTDKLIEVLSTSLKGRRLFAFGGLLKQIAKQIGIEELAEGDLVHIDEEKVREDVATVLEVYRWNFGLANYVKDI
ncbi:MAG: protein rep [Spirochaetota bacterium]|nr:protein rep [Spirochaetota bacterium]